MTANMSHVALHNLTIQKLGEGLREKKFSAAEVTHEYLSEIERRDGEIGAYLSVWREDAMAEAAHVDRLVAAGKELPPLGGVPIAVKDVILIKGQATTAASKILEHYVAAYDATVIAKLKEQHAVFLGKTNCDEFTMGSSTENSAFKITKNPRDTSRVPGGSSGGSAAAVAAGMTLAALGSDTGGSIRQPASFCGIVGLKPTYGAVSRSGLIAMASSLDQIGPMGKTVEDAAILFSHIAGVDPMDSTSCAASYGRELLAPDFAEVKNLTVGLPEEYFIEGTDEATRRAVDEVIETYKKLGVAFKKISLPHTKYALSAYYILMPAEVSANLARFDGVRYGRSYPSENLLELYLKNRGEGFGAEAKRRIILGAFVLSSGYYDAYYGRAQAVRSLIKQDFENAFESVDAILAPVSPTPAFKIGEKTDDPLSMYLSDIFTITVNLAGLPALAVPARTASPLPVGFQLIGRPFREADILGLGRLYEKE